jgi:hypothetical protein
VASRPDRGRAGLSFDIHRDWSPIMSKPGLNIDQLAVQSFTTAAADQEIGAADMDTGCVSGCDTGCGFGGSIC